MRVICRHGHFAFYPVGPSDISHFASMYKVSMKREQDYYTFSFLTNMADWSIPLYPYKNLPAKVLYEGQPWEVMRENGFVYSLTLKLLVPKETIVGAVNVPSTGYYFTTSTPILQPGLIDSAGNRLLSYDAEFDFNIQKMRIREFQYV